MGSTQQYEGKQALVVGGATGIGAAVAQRVGELGASVTVLDVAPVSYPVAASIQVDLRDRASVDRAASEIGPVDAIFSCAGVADGTSGLILINFIAQRHLIETLRSHGKLRRGGGIVMVSSVAGLPWTANLAAVLDFIAQPDWDAMVSWIAEHEGTDSYGFSKQAVNAYVAHAGFSLLKEGVRINAVLPGPTDTPLARANADLWLGFGADYRAQVGIGPLAPEQIADSMIFLASPAASGVNGVTMLVDAGHVAAGLTGAYDDPIIKMILGVQ